MNTYTYEYLWLDHDGDIRGKTMITDQLLVLDGGTTKNLRCGSLEDWTYDGSSTKQAIGTRSDVIIRPQAVFYDPFCDNGYLVVCDTYELVNYETGEVKPHLDNTRRECMDVMDRAIAFDTEFGLEQEYILYHKSSGRPYGWETEDSPGLRGGQGPYYCSAGGDKSFGRDIVLEHQKMCDLAGVRLSGVNAEVMPGQWEYQVGKCKGFEIGDHMLVARYLLERVTEMFYDVCVSFHPKPKDGDWNGSGCHCNFSTAEMRAEGGYDHIVKARNELAKHHMLHMECYGEDNNKRMSGKHETAVYDEFLEGKFGGVGDRGASVRIPLGVFLKKCGYLEDRRPGSNCDTYKVVSRMVKTVCLGETE